MGPEISASGRDNFSLPRTLGRSGLMAGALGMGASYGAPAKAYEMAFESGCNYFYWGSWRRDGMKEAVHNLAGRHREKMIVVLQFYWRLPSLLKRNVSGGLKNLKLDYADVLLLGWHNNPPGRRLMDAALELKNRGIVKALAVSCHHRPTFQTYIADSRFDIIMLRYNAAHRGAEREVFPCLEASASRPGVIAYTATRWGHLLRPKYMPAGEKTPTAVDCYRFVLSNPYVDVCLTGPASYEELEANLKVLESKPLAPDETQWLRAAGDRVHRLTSRKIFVNPFMQRVQ